MCQPWSHSGFCFHILWSTGEINPFAIDLSGEDGRTVEMMVIKGSIWCLLGCPSNLTLPCSHGDLPLAPQIAAGISQMSRTLCQLHAFSYIASPPFKDLPHLKLMFCLAKLISIWPSKGNNLHWVNSVLLFSCSTLPFHLYCSIQVLFLAYPLLFTKL